MRIGITERGDAGIDFSWVPKVENKEVDGAVLITKRISRHFGEEVLRLHKKGIPLIIHCTCTGWGSSWMEPNVPSPGQQLKALGGIIQDRFPKERCVLRLDPLIPTKEGFQRAAQVLGIASRMGLLPGMHVRFSILDEYPHVKERLRAAGQEPFYPDFQPTERMLRETAGFLANYPYVTFESCAETALQKYGCRNVVATGCVSQKDLSILGLGGKPMGTNPQGRAGCMCLSCKTELLESRHRCPHKCAYCYWHD